MRDKLLDVMVVAYLGKKFGDEFSKIERYEPGYARYLRSDAMMTMDAVLAEIERLADISERAGMVEH